MKNGIFTKVTEDEIEIGGEIGIIIRIDYR